MNDDNPFSPAVVGFLAAGLVAIFALSVVLTSKIGGEQDGYRATRSSPSAIGHAGFYALLRALDLPVGYSGSEAVKAAGAGADDGLLIVEEPDADLVRKRDDLDLSRGPDVLVVLPKRWGTRDHSHEGWIETSGLQPLWRTQKMLRLVLGSASVTRVDNPVIEPSGRVATLPKLEGSVQLINGRDLIPLITAKGGATGDGMLLAEARTPDRGHIYVLADPDALENHGILRGDNARFAADLVAALWSGEGSIVFDETVHQGYLKTRNPLQLLFQFPYSLVLALLLVAVALLLAAATSRFGGPEAPPPPLAAGKGPIIGNTAALMDRAGPPPSVLRRYIRPTQHETGRALHAPSGLDDGELADWLDRIGASRGLAASAREMLARSTAFMGGRTRQITGLFAQARDIRQWQRDMTDGTHGRRQPR